MAWHHKCLDICNHSCSWRPSSGSIDMRTGTCRVRTLYNAPFFWPRPGTHLASDWRVHIEKVADIHLVFAWQIMIVSGYNLTHAATPVVTCANVWPNWIVVIKINAKRNIITAESKVHNLLLWNGHPKWSHVDSKESIQRLWNTILRS